MTIISNDSGLGDYMGNPPKSSKEYSELYINKFCEHHNIIRDNVIDWGQYFTVDPGIATCLNILGMISKEQLKYADSLGGCFTVTIGDVSCDVTLEHLLRSIYHDI